MKNYLILGIATIIFTFSPSTQAAGKNIKFGMSIPRLTLVEYEQKLGIPMLSAYINYGTGSPKIESQKTSISGVGLGARLNIPILGYIGLGYGMLNVDYSYIEPTQKVSINAGSRVDVDGSMNGLVIEYGKTFSIGPVLIGGSLGALLGKPSVTGKVNGIKVTSSEIDAGLANVEWLPQVGFYLGYSF